MKKLLVNSFLFIVYSLLTFMLVSLTSQPVMASVGDVSIKIEEPKTPTNDNDFNITFVALDVQNRTINVKCFKKGPDDGGFAQFGSDIALSAGGNTNTCHVDSSLMNKVGTYQFYTEANAGGDISTSSTVTVAYKTESPSTPYNFSKEKVNSCEYKIKFKTGADNGLTKKVEIYMSSLKSFPADAGTKVGEVGIGSDQEGSFNKVLPAEDCDKTFYFVIRAFDDAGNGSGTVGDSETTVVTIEPTTKTTTTTQAQGAIPVNSSQVSGGEVLGASKVEATDEAEILGTESTPSAMDQSGVEGAKSQAGSNLFSFKNIVILIIVLFGAGGVYLYRRYKR